MDYGYGKLGDFNRLNGKDKLSDFAYDFYHRDMILKYSEKKFIERYESWSKKKGYIFKEEEARQLYSIAKESIPTLEASDNTKLIVHETVNVLKEVNACLFSILPRMTELAKQMPEYNTVMAMKGVGPSIGPRIIAEIGDPVCEYFLRKRAEGKHYRVAMFAAYNKFLRIYHSRVSSVLNEMDA